MAIVHVAAIHTEVHRDDGGHSDGYMMSGTWIDEYQEEFPWHRTLGKPTFSANWRAYAAAYEVYETMLIPWCPNLR